MKTVIAVLISVYSYNDSKDYYIFKYKDNSFYKQDTVILPKNQLKLKDTIQYQANVSKIKRMGIR